MDKHYVVTKPAFKSHYAIASEDGQDDYFVNIKTKIKPSQPRLTFYSGSDKQGPIVAVLHFQASKVNMKIGVGDPTDISAVEWEDLSCMNKLTHAKYNWSANLPSQEASEILSQTSSAHKFDRKTFTWTRTRSQSIDGTKPTARTNRHWKLSEEGSEELLAVFTGQAKIGQCGTLAVRSDLGDKFRLMALVTLVGLYERVRTSGGG